MTQPLVSFIIPVLNGEDFIGRCLRSIRQQMFSGGEYEVLVIDNGSTDRTLQIIQELGIAYEVVQKLKVSGLRNYGVSKTKGEYLAFIDSDVEIFSDWIEHAVFGLKHQRVVAGGCFPMIPLESTWVQKTWDLHQRRHEVSTTMQPISWLPSMNLIVRRKDFIAINGFNEKLVTAEDVDFCYRLGERGDIICNPNMRATHWGEAPDIKTFWRKESWRGLGNLPGLFSHGFQWNELPSIGYPIYHLVVGLLFLLGSIIGFFTLQFWIFPLFLLLLIAPAFLLAVHTIILTKDLFYFPQLFFLYQLYGWARAFAIVKSICRDS